MRPRRPKAHPRAWPAAGGGVGRLKAGRGLTSLAAPAAAAAGGAAAAWSLPPHGWWLGLPLAAALLAGSLRGQRLRARAAHGALFGATWFSVALWWMTTFAAAGYLVLVVVSALVTATAAAAVPAERSLTATPAALAAVELIRLHWPFGGFPVGGLALGQADGPWLHVAAWTGSNGVVLLAGLAGTAASALTAVLLQAPTSSRRPGGGRATWRAAGPLVLVLGAALLLALDRPQPGPAAGSLTVTAVQGGGPRGIPAVQSDAGAVLQRQVELSTAVPAAAELVVWPEDVVSVDGMLAGSAQAATLRRVAAGLGRPLVAGVVEDVGAGRFANASVVVAADGRFVSRYDKVHRVPFGEYVPGRRFLRRFVDLSLIPKDAVAGDGPPVLSGLRAPLGIVISYEVFFPARARAAARAGGQLLLVPTNAASFTSPQVPAQELAAAQLRAAETARALVQAAPTGYSALIDPRGTVLRASRLGRPEVLTGSLPLSVRQTPYVRFGDIPLLTVLLAVGAHVWVRPLRLSLRSRHPRRHPQERMREAGRSTTL